MRIIRLLGALALWAGALLGLVAGSAWIAGRLGYVQPMIVISGSMEPGIMTGDLLIDRSIPTADVEVDDVLSLPSGMTGKLVTHRVISVLPDGDSWAIRMKGDANADEDFETYIVGDSVWTPWIRIPQGGKVVSKVMEPAVAVPILLALVALLGLSLLDEEPRRVVRRAVRRVARRDPKLDELDEELAAIGIDVARLREMDDLDLKLYALGIEFENPPPDADRLELTVNGRRVEDGLWSFTLPPSDGVGLVPTPAKTHAATDPNDQTNHLVPERSPARSG